MFRLAQMSVAESPFPRTSASDIFHHNYAEAQVILELNNLMSSLSGYKVKI